MSEEWLGTEAAASESEDEDEVRPRGCVPSPRPRVAPRGPAGARGEVGQWWGTRESALLPAAPAGPLGRAGPGSVTVSASWQGQEDGERRHRQLLEAVSSLSGRKR